MRNNNGIVLFDFSTMPKTVFFPLLKMVKEICKTFIICIYTTPQEYTSAPLSYEPGEPKIISGFSGRPWKYESLDVWIPILGFEAKIAKRIMSWGNFDKVFPIIAFPGYRAYYVDRVFIANSELLSESRVEKVYYSTAKNPLNTEFLISALISSHKENNITLSPMGPKPNSLGLCLAALKHDLRIVYAQPWDYNPHYSSGVGTTYAYLLK